MIKKSLNKAKYLQHDRNVTRLTLANLMFRKWYINRELVSEGSRVTRGPVTSTTVTGKSKESSFQTHKRHERMLELR